MKKHINIPVFIPHLGCPNQCVFCNQRTISGVKEFYPESVIDVIDGALATVPEDADVEIAFFGGSFTGIDPDLMENLLKIANSYLKQGRISSIRCSTRPDYINDNILNTLKRYGVRTVELGIQSFSDSVLAACKRGHTSLDEAFACKKIKEYGFRLGAQMMIGLPGATVEDEIRTARFAVSVGADEARIYPTLVFKDTELYTLTVSGEYLPLSVDDAVERSAAVFEILTKAGIKILRIGLCDSENLHSMDTYYGGPNHAAIGELVEGEYYYRLIKKKLSEIELSDKKMITVVAPPGQTSKIIGQLKKNKIRLLREYGISLKVVESEEVEKYNILLKAEERK